MANKDIDKDIKNLEKKLSLLYEAKSKADNLKKESCTHKHVIAHKSSWVDKGYGLDREYPLLEIICEDCGTYFGSIEVDNDSYGPKPLKNVLEYLIESGVHIPGDILKNAKFSVVTTTVTTKKLMRN